MTLTIICGSGHMTAYNLTSTNSLHKVEENEDGTVSVKEWDWDYWRCPKTKCEHREYVSHIVDNPYEGTWGEPNSKTMMIALFAISTMLTIKTRMGL